ncbi:MULTISPECIES: DUF1801 domain-containing protein [unclassified Ruegeria]|uniref:DUF1801 domain-containing protein n=1 Tax=unclassified Ruegeria TaxID=2625375 RepID=UPI001AD9B886|nr:MULTISPECIES: DUF1801 domain-containing protein [unclassified Ruegeria]MBO9413148.1 DUF1801 domain-containing protein [Ruegeria sp. R8_1]MBO9416868.1 DUF1801 domain-containing protein [Ruegeria sp. R8_2]
MTPFQDPAVQSVFDGYNPDTQKGVLALRELIFETALTLPSAQPLQEALRWGQPAYLAPKGSTIRVGGHKTASFALFVHCQSRLISDFTSAFPDEDRLEGNRAVLFDDPRQIDANRHGWLIARALTYHL